MHIRRAHALRGKVYFPRPSTSTIRKHPPSKSYGMRHLTGLCLWACWTSDPNNLFSISIFISIYIYLYTTKKSIKWFCPPSFVPSLQHDSLSGAIKTSLQIPLFAGPINNYSLMPPQLKKCRLKSITLHIHPLTKSVIPPNNVWGKWGAFHLPSKLLTLPSSLYSSPTFILLFV